MANRCTSQYYAADFVTVRTAPFDALYSMCIIFCPTMPPMGDMFTMELLAAASICRITLFMPENQQGRQPTVLQFSHSFLSVVGQLSLGEVQWHFALPIAYCMD